MTTDTTLKPGDAVRCVPDPAKWRKGAVKSLSGMAGVIVEVRSEVRSSDPRVGTTPSIVLVRLNERPSPWHAGQIPSHGWWFEPGELEPVSTPF